MTKLERTGRPRRVPFTILAISTLLASLLASAAVAHSPGEDLDFQQTQFYGLTAAEIADLGITNEDDCGNDVGEVGWHFVAPGGHFDTVTITYGNTSDTEMTYPTPDDTSAVQTSGKGGEVKGVYFVTDADATLEEALATGAASGNKFVLSHVCVPETALIRVTKFIDANENGVNDDGAADPDDLAGWTFTVAGPDPSTTVVCNLTTDSTGTAECEVDPGTYTVTETNVGDPLTSNGASTIVTTTNPQLVGVVAGDVGEAVFGNTCVITKHFEVSGVPSGATSVVVDYTGTHTGQVTLSDQGGGTWTGTATDTFQIGDTLSWTATVDGGTAQDGGSETFGTADGYPACERTNTLELEPPTITVTKAKDADDDGDPTDPDTGLANWEILLLQNTDDDPELEQIDSEMTDADGVVVFGDDPGEELLPGTYTVCETQQTNWVQTYPAECHEVTVDFNDEASEVFLNSPLSEIRVGFTDLTGFTNASIVCYDADGNEIESLSYDSITPAGTDADSVDNEYTIRLSELVGPDGEIGTADDGVDCTFKIIDP